MVLSGQLLATALHSGERAPSEHFIAGRKDPKNDLIIVVRKGNL
jgi:hypothetical protein